MIRLTQKRMKIHHASYTDRLKTNYLLMKKGLLFLAFTTFVFLSAVKSQSHAYVYISPDYGGCTGKLMIYPVCIDLPQPITFTANIGGNIQSTQGPWMAYLCAPTTTQFTITAQDGLGNNHTLLSGTVNINFNTASVTYSTQTITNPLTIIHKYQPSGAMCDGSTDFSITGGYPPYFYNLVDFSNNVINLTLSPPNNYIANNLCPGSYIFSIADNFSSPNCPQNSNPISIPFDINFFDCLIDPIDLTCAGVCDGAAQIIPLGDMNLVYSSITGPNGSGAFSITDQCSGNVSGILIHSSGKQATCFGIIDEPMPLSVSITTTDCSGFGINDGTATALVSGGTPGYTYLWNNGDTQNFADSLSAGNICVLVMDVNGCDTTVCANVNQPPQIMIQITGITHQTSTTPNGSVTFTVSGGVQPYVISLIRYNYNDTIGGPFTGLEAGNYAIYVTDANGIKATQPFTINNNISGLAENSIPSIKVFPNPANDRLFVSAQNISDVEIYHVSGQIVLHQLVNNENTIQLNISELASGSYFIKVMAQQHQKVLPFIKQ
jgi:hypothetical protein